MSGNAANWIVAGVAVITMLVTLWVNAIGRGEITGVTKQSIANLQQSIETLAQHAASRQRVDAIEARVTALESKQDALATFREEVLSRLTRIETKLSERLSYEPTHGEVERN